jgi:mono/diheme cytochrome c family protein
MGSQKPFAVVLLQGIVFCMVLIWTGCRSGKSDQGWTAPAEAARLKSPFQDTLLAAQKGKELYNMYCWSCHGENGFGDGAAGHGQGQKPANFHEPRVQQQKDGALFWKMSTGKGTMPAFKEVLSDTQRWQLVSYIRRLSSQAAPLVPPRALRPDVQVAHFMSVGPQSVRLFQNPISHTLYYTTFDGDVFRINNQDSAQPTAVKILSVADHGITRLQGAAFRNNTLFLCGNVDAENKKGTSGRMVRYDLDSAAPRNRLVVFNTVEYGANKTIFDHGWNALEISPDGKNIFVNSGARTDHGEVQDNGGMYPNARDNALTGKIFRFPIDAKDLYLNDDAAALKAAGYIYAEGIRNAYDMAFDAAGNLFAVVNSADYDMPEDMFWVREGHHYGFPWVMGGIENPQQYADWQPSPDTDPFINKYSHSWEVKYFHNDPGFPKIPAGVKFSPGVQNLGPDANEYRGHTGKILDGDQTGVAVSTFTPHASPLGLFFDTHHVLGNGLKGDGFVIRYSLGAKAPMMKPFTHEGADLLHLRMTYDSTMDNYVVRTTRILDGFKEPSDAVLVGNTVYVIEYGGKGGNIWKITLPAEAENRIVKSNPKKLHSP